MRYDLKTAHTRCSELGLTSAIQAGDRLEIAVAPGIALCLQNSETDQDCLLGFEGTPWHTHDDLMFSDSHGNFVEMSYLEMLACLADGRLLVCELWKNEAVNDRWLIHRDCNDEFKHMEPGEEIRVFRVAIPSAASHL